MRRKIDIIGAGALGLGIAVTCAQRGLGVRVRGRSGYLTKGKVWVGSTEVDSSFIPLPQGQAECVIIATKAYDLNADIAKEVISRSNESLILCIQNGLVIRELFDLQGRLMRAIVTARAEKLSTGVVKWREPISVTIDANERDSELAVSLLKSPWIRINLTEDFNQALFRKLLINAAINSLTAINNINCCELFTNRELVARAYGIAKEIALLADASGVTLTDKVENIIDAALRSMGTFRPSMLQDLTSGHAIELEAIVGEPIKLAGNLGIRVPMLTTTYQELSRKSGYWAGESNTTKKTNM